MFKETVSNTYFKKYYIEKEENQVSLLTTKSYIEHCQELNVSSQNFCVEALTPGVAGAFMEVIIVNEVLRVTVLSSRISILTRKTPESLYFLCNVRTALRR